MSITALQLLWVGAGGFVGAVLRFVMTLGVNHLLERAWTPYGTMTVNILGCFLLGLLSELSETRGLLGPNARLFMLVGLLGGFTTFSTFEYETLMLMREGRPMRAMANAGIQVAVGFAAAAAGFGLARLFGSAGPPPA